jgi:hypothetical protein
MPRKAPLLLKYPILLLALCAFSAQAQITCQRFGNTTTCNPSSFQPAPLDFAAILAARRQAQAAQAAQTAAAGVDIPPYLREKLERLCRYVSRPPIAEERLTLTASGPVRYTLKTPYRDGTTHIVLEPLDLMARLAALVPPPRMHLTRFHGVFAPHGKLRAAVTPAHRGVGAPKAPACNGGQVPPSTPRHVAMSWARRLKRVFGIDIESCARCGGKLKVIASIEEPVVIAKILEHLEKTAPERHQAELPLGARAPPTQGNLL